MSNLKIISDGTADGTRIYVGNERMSGVARIEIEPILPFGLVRATLTVDFVSLKMQFAKADIKCTDDVTAERLREALLHSETGIVMNDLKI